MTVEEHQAQTPVINPATGAEIGRVPTLTPEDVEFMATRARAVQPAWEALGYRGRGQVLRRMQRWLVDNQDRVIETICSETGKAHEDALIAELLYGQAALGFWAKSAPKYLRDEKIRASNKLLLGKQVRSRYRPLGVVGVIGPWNYPLTNSFGDAIPALAAGNCVILKPASVTPLTSILLLEGLRECGLPEDVLQIATGPGSALGNAIIDAVDMIMFTGSTGVGKRVMERAAQTVTPVSLELGGKDPMIVLADADVERAAHHAVYYSMFNTGQTCISIERVYVEDGIYHAFVERVVEKASALRLGVPTGPGAVDVGSLTTGDQVDTVEAQVEDAKAKGARVLVGGKRGDAAGHWYAPTVLVGVDHSMEIMTEETFGPTLPIMRVHSADEAVRCANDSPYGLSGAVFGRDLKQATEVAERMESGSVCINDALVNYTALEAPLGGAKTSGLGQRHGAGGIRKYCQQQTILTSRIHPRRDVHTYPYRRSRAAALKQLARVLYGRGRS